MTFPTSEERRYVLLWGQGTGQRHRVAELLGVWGDSWVDSGRGRGSPIWTTCDLPMPGIPKRARGLGLPWGTRMRYWQEGLALRCGGKPPDSSQNPGVAQKHTRKVNSFGEPRGGPSLNQTISQIVTHTLFQGNVSAPPKSILVERGKGAVEGHSSNWHCVRVSTSTYIHIIIIIQCSHLQRAGTAFYQHGHWEQARSRGQAPSSAPQRKVGCNHRGKGGHTSPSPRLPSEGHLDSSKVICKRQGQ